MGREVRRVPRNWEHPKNDKGCFIGLFDGHEFEEAVKKWDEGSDKWSQGLRSDYKGGWKPLDGTEGANTYEEWGGERPSPNDYMPVWSDKEATHLAMYETCSEGTPISPAFETPEALARWLVDNEASAFGGQAATYEGWLRVARGGYACSAVASLEAGIVSGVDGFK